jgi:orotate phosphoribosyltransferase
VVESAEVVQLIRPRAGHFDLGTGYHGDLWLDLDALFLSPARLRPYVDWLAERLRGHGVDAVCGPLEGGALLAYAVADRLGVAFLAGYRAPGVASYRLPRVHGGIGGWRVGVARAGVSPVCRRRPGHAGRGRRPVSATSRSMTGASAPTSTGASNMPAGVRSTTA